ncbi:MAG: AraC family transcriptional regulator [Parvularcula sp.]|jgi:AraC-like DNA-binding protein|nr:AraC family transcriptional regulator [Parvularcula sp.]
MRRLNRTNIVSRIEPVAGTLAGLRVVHAASWQAFPKHSHDEFGIGLMTSGCQRSVSGLGFVHAEAGDVITVSPGEVHDGAPGYTDSRSWSMIYLEPELVASLECEWDGRAEEMEFKAPHFRDRLVASQVRNLIASAQIDGPTAPALAIEQAVCIVLAMTLHRRAKRNEVSAPDVTCVKTLIDDLCHTDISLADMGRLAGLSRFQVIRGMRKLTGMTPHQYVVFRRLERARRAIASGASLADAAAASGFFDQSHMTRHFRRLHGFAPGRLKPCAR